PYTTLFRSPRKPSSPCGLPRRATTTRSGSVEELTPGGDPLFFASSRCCSPNRLGDTAPTSNDPAHVPFCGPHLGDHLVRSLLNHFDDHRLGVIDDAANHIGHHPFDNCSAGHLLLLRA